MDGVPQKHTFWQTPYGYPNGVTGNTPPHVQRDGGTGKILEHDFDVWVPPGACYAKVKPEAVIRCETGGATVNFKVRNRDATATGDFVLGTGTHTLDTNELLPCAPGKWNRWTILVDCSNLGAGATVYLLWLGAHQVTDSVQAYF